MDPLVHWLEILIKIFSLTATTASEVSSAFFLRLLIQGLY